LKFLGREILTLKSKPVKISPEYKELLSNSTYIDITIQMSIFSQSLEEDVIPLELVIENDLMKAIKL
jgi:hypothetical protein